MKLTQPHVAVVSRPQIDWPAMAEFLDMVGGQKWFNRVSGVEVDTIAKQMPDGEVLVEFGGRECYRSWDVGLNPNVTMVREDSAAYLENILKSRHGSVLQHANYSFILHNVTRVATHELVRHVAGTAFSQESMRYVRLDDIPVWVPDWALADKDLMERVVSWLDHTEHLQLWMADHFDLDNPAVKFEEKKAKTSFMRRWSPQGVSTGMLFTANVRALRWIGQLRTDGGAEEEIRIIADKICEAMKVECPILFGDFEKQRDGSWIPRFEKV